jgi:hypothetical protein
MPLSSPPDPPRPLPGSGRPARCARERPLDRPFGPRVTAKWTCGPVLGPVDPTVASTSPAATFWPRTHERPLNPRRRADHVAVANVDDIPGTAAPAAEHHLAARYGVNRAALRRRDVDDAMKSRPTGDGIMRQPFSPGGAGHSTAEKCSCSRPRSRRSAWACNCETRDSVSPSTAPASLMVIPS